MGIKLMGRPKIYNTVEELSKQIQYYFDSITMDVPETHLVDFGKDEKGKKKYKSVPTLNNASEQIVNIVFVENPGVISMCVFLGITRETLLQMEKIDTNFSDTIKAARTIILSQKLKILPTMKNPRGMMFDLSANYGMHEKQEIEYTDKKAIVVGDIDE